jgi:hypothetical protein
MAHTLNLKYGGTTVALAAGDYRIESYTPAPADEGASVVVETARIQITASSLAAMQADVAVIDRAFEWGRMRSAGKVMGPVVVQFQGDGEALLWQSEISDGRTLMPDGLLKTDWANKVISVAVIWTRAAFWEGAVWTALPLTNTNGTDNTSGLRVYGCNDGSGSAPSDRVMYLDVDGVNDVLGNLPAPVKLQIIPSGSINHVYIGMQADQGDGLATPFFEMEDIDVGSSTADATCSGGDYCHLDINAADITDFSAFVDPTTYNGGYHKIFMRFFSAVPDDLRIQFVETVAGDTYSLAETPWVNPDADQALQTFGELRIPVRELLPSSGSLGNYALELDVKSSSSGTLNLDVDYIFAMPMDAYVELGSSTGSVGSSQMIVYSEGIERMLYRDILASGAPVSIFDEHYGGGIFLRPGVNQRLWVLSRNSDTHSVSNYLTVKAWYKPRRSTL